MRIVALLALRNEALYLGRCLEHLAGQGIETCVIDNGSTDASRAIAESYRGRGVMEIVDYPYPGYYDWAGLLRMKEDLASTIRADWFIHHDADEIHEAPRPWSTLAEGFAAVDREGYNAVNFDEFVFFPTRDEDDFEGKDYVAAMQHYYFFEPRTWHRVKAWKNAGVRVDLVTEGGHRVGFTDQRIAPTPFILRHYIALSPGHFLRKYRQERFYSKHEVEERGWHGWRAGLEPQRFRLPDASEMKTVRDGFWDRSDPARAHRFLASGA